MTFSKGFHIALAVIVVLVALFVPHPFDWGSLLLAVPIAGSVLTDSDLMRLLQAFNIFDAAGGLKLNVVVKTANYTILSSATSAAGDRSGTIFTNRGAGGAVTFTLPTPVALLAGVWYEFIGIAGQNIIVATPGLNDTLVVLNDAAADSLAIQTAGQLIGAHMRVFCDGTQWIAMGDIVGVTYTVAT